MKNIFFTILVALCVQVQAATYHWDGATTDWNTVTNWKVGTTFATAVVSTTLPSSADVVVISFGNGGFTPNLANATTLASITIDNGKVLNLNGYNLTINGNATFTSGSLVNSVATAAALTVNNATAISASTGFVFGQSTSDLLTLSFNVIGTTNSLNFQNALFNVQCSVVSPQIYISGCTFYGDLSLRRPASNYDNNTVVGQNTYYGNLTISSYLKPLLVGSLSDVSNFNGIDKKISLINQGNYQSSVGVQNFSFNAGVTIEHNSQSTGSGGVVVNKAIFNGKANIINYAKLITINQASVNFGEFNVESRGTYPIVVNNISSSQALTVNSYCLNQMDPVGAFSTFNVNNSTFSNDVTFSHSGVGRCIFSNLTQGSNMTINNTGGDFSITTLVVNNPSINLNGTGTYNLNSMTSNRDLDINNNSSGSVTMTTSTFNGVVNFNKNGTGAHNIYGLTSMKLLTINQNSAGNITFYNTCVYQDDVKLVGNGTGAMTIAGTSSKKIILKSPSLGYFVFGYGTALKMLSGSQIVVDDVFVAGNILFNGVTEEGLDGLPTKLVFPNSNNNVGIMFGNAIGSNFTDDVEVIGRVQVHNATFGNAKLTVNGNYDRSTNTQFWGSVPYNFQIIFNGDAEINVTGVSLQIQFGGASGLLSFSKNATFNISTGNTFSISRGRVYSYGDFVFNYAADYPYIYQFANAYAYQLGGIDAIAYFVGSADQTIRSNRNLDFSCVSVNKPSGILYLDGPTSTGTVLGITKTSSSNNYYGFLDLTKGVIKCLNNSVVGLYSTAVVLNGNSSSYVDGMVMRSYPLTSLVTSNGDNGTFPLGCNGKYYPAVLNSANGGFLMKHIKSPLGNTSHEGSNDVVDCEYYDVQAYNVNWTTGAPVNSTFALTSISLPHNNAINCGKIIATDLKMAYMPRYSSTYATLASPIWKNMTGGSTTVTAAPSTYPTGTNLVTYTGSMNVIKQGFLSFFTCATGSSAAQTLSTSLGSGNVCPNQPLTFTASSNISALSPTYKWFVGGVEQSGATSSTFTSSTLSDGAVVTATASTTSTCVSNPTVTSNAVTVQYPSPAVIDGASTYCMGNLPLTLSASPSGGTFSGTGVTNGVFSPSVAGSYTISYASSVGGCPTTTVTKDISVSANTIPSVSLTSTPQELCASSLVAFEMQHNLNSFSPLVQWKLNGTSVAENVPTYAATTLKEGDVLSVEVSSTSPCVVPNSASASRNIHFVGTAVPKVNLSSNLPLPVLGSTVVLNVAVVDGTTGTFTWLKNGVSVATGGNSYTTNLADGDFIQVEYRDASSCLQGIVYKSNILRNVAQNLYGQTDDASRNMLHNVSKGVLKFAFEEKYASGTLQYKIKNGNGVEVYSDATQVVTKSLGQNYVSINLDGIPQFVSGALYVLEIKNGKGYKEYLRFVYNAN